MRGSNRGRGSREGYSHIHRDRFKFDNDVLGNWLAVLDPHLDERVKQLVDALHCFLLGIAPGDRFFDRGTVRLICSASILVLVFFDDDFKDVAKESILRQVDIRHTVTLSGRLLTTRGSYISYAQRNLLNFALDKE